MFKKNQLMLPELPNTI